MEERGEKGIVAALERLEHKVEDMGRKALHSDAARGGGLVALEAVVFMGINKVTHSENAGDVAVEAVHLLSEVVG